jgi:hypothetical protein
MKKEKQVENTERRVRVERAKRGRDGQRNVGCTEV